MEDPLRREVTLYAPNERGHTTEKREEARTRKRERKGKGKKESEKKKMLAMEIKEISPVETRTRIQAQR